MIKALRTVGRYFMLMGRTFSRPERMRMFFRQYLNELEQLGVNSIGIVLLISFFIGAVITIQIKLNIESPWMPRWTFNIQLNLNGNNRADEKRNQQHDTDGVHT